jgi:hypothetical protein
MIKNAFFLTAILFIVLLLALLQECRFLIPYRDLLLHQYGTTILAFSTALFLNVFTAVYLVCRKLFLKDTGRKLIHLDKQLRTHSSILDELARYLAD